MKLKGNIKDITYKTIGSAGCDLRSTIDLVLPAGEWYAVPTGVYIERGQPNEYLQVVPRSGLAYKQGITVLNSPGTIDYDYPDEIKVILINHSKDIVAVRVGDRIAQLILSEYKHIENISIESSERTGGLGSTGVK